MHGQAAVRSKEYLTVGADTFYIRMNLAQNEVILDTQTCHEYGRKRIPGAVHAPRSEKLLSIADTLDREQPLFVYCRDDYRSTTACKILAGEGFLEVYDLRGGLRQWERAGYPVDKKRIRRPCSD